MEVLTKKTEIKRGDVYYVDLAKSNKFPHNQSGRRPVIVMSNNKNNKNCDYINVVPLTHCVKRSFLPTHVTISVDDCSFLKCNSQFLGELYQPIGKEDFYEENYLGHIENGDLMEKFGNAIMNHISN